MIELLSPAGSMEALRAAVQNGADAVYLGAGGFNARMGARNFTLDDLREAVTYCHVRGVRVHLTLNTLASDRELPEAAELIRRAAQLGVDAFIVQDLGLVSMCREIAPTVEVHASTQMSIHNLDGVKLAAKLGCSRVVLARELPESEIAAICRESPVEIEVFGHGALCMCYSGQCYFSAVIGRRSGNRGQCAQPCRLPCGYGRYQQQYPLSLKDNCAIEHLLKLEGMGVHSLKLEGRMKRPEYVAVVTRIYRAALDGKPVSRKDLEELQGIFSRQGFTDGYLRDQVDRSMLGIRTGEREDKQLLAKARATYETGELSRVPVRFQIDVQPGRPVTLLVADWSGHVCRAEGPVPEQAISRPVTEEELTTRLSKTGGTPYVCRQVQAQVAPGMMVPASVVNGLRREALIRLSALRGQLPKVPLHSYTPAHAWPAHSGRPVLTVQVRSLEQVTPSLLAARPTVLYVPVSELADHPDRVGALCQRTEVCAVLPRVVWGREWSKVRRQLETVRQLGVSTVLIGNLGQIVTALELGMELRGDFGLNVCNTLAAQQVRRLHFRSLTASFELRLAQIRDLGKALPTELLVYGRLPLMLTESCLIRNRTGVCNCHGQPTSLVDRTGAEFPILPDPGTCRSVVLNGRKLFLLDRHKELGVLGVWGHRLLFTTENPREVDLVVRAWQSGGVFDPGQHTRGLYVRGVE